MKREKLKLSTILSYALATGSGYQIMGSLVGAYLMIFLTDTFGVPAGAVGVITVVASVWDAINDPMMGTIADRTKSRWGKYRPYFLFIPAILDVYKRQPWHQCFRRYVDCQRACMQYLQDWYGQP